MGEDLRECFEHGVFRGEECPQCGERGKRLMNEYEIEGLGRILAGMLRHFPENYGVRLNEHGWVKVYSIVPAIRARRKSFGWLTARHIESMALTDPKERYQVNREHEIRATYGHTIPVELDDLPNDELPDILFYQTTEEELEFIKETGISPSDKTWIHLSKTYRQAYVSGLFHVESPKIVGIDIKKLVASGINVYRATSDVFVSREIPPEFILDLEAEDVELTEYEKSEIQKVKQRREKRISRDQP